MNTNVVLRVVSENDLAICFEQQLDPEANALAAFPARDEETFYAHWKKIMRDESVILKAIVFENQVAGNIVSFEIRTYACHFESNEKSRFYQRDFSQSPLEMTTVRKS